MNLPRKPIPGLKCSQEQFEAIHERLARTRSTSETVTVDRKGLAALLQDYSRLHEIVERLP